MELVIVDDGSVDDTPGYLAALAAREPWVKVITRARGWQASARNKGIAVSRGELVAITDDDCTVAKEWLLTIASAMQDQDLSAIGGRVHAPGNHLIARYLDYVRALDPMLLPDGTPRNLVTANACFRRSALERTGFFDEAFGIVGGEDTELTLRIRESGMRLRFVPTCHVSHWYEPDVVAFLRRYYRYGFGNRLIFDKHLTWEQWLPHADAGLRALMNGHARWREFHELEDTYLRPAYILLHTLQHFSYLAGYLHLTDVAQLDKLRRSDENNRHQSGTDSTRAVSNEARREQSEATHLPRQAKTSRSMNCLTVLRTIPILPQMLYSRCWISTSCLGWRYLKICLM